MVYQRNAWTLICDNGLSQDDAVVVCRMFGYNFGTHLPGSKFGSVQAQIGITNVRCHGRENDFMKCPYDVSTACPSHKYASVVCSNESIREESELRRVLKPAQTCHEIYQAATLRLLLFLFHLCCECTTTVTGSDHSGFCLRVCSSPFPLSVTSTPPTSPPCLPLPSLPSLPFSLPLSLPLALTLFSYPSQAEPF